MGLEDIRAPFWIKCTALVQQYGDNSVVMKNEIASETYATLLTAFVHACDLLFLLIYILTVPVLAVYRTALAQIVLEHPLSLMRGFEYAH